VRDLAAAGRAGALPADAPSMDGLRACVHCGICLPQCPTYRVLGQEVDSPRGRLYLMRAAAEGRIEPSPAMARHLDLCLGCRACETACPSGVPFGQLLEATRGQLQRRGIRAAETDRGALARALALFPHPRPLAPRVGALGLYERSGIQGAFRGLGRLAGLGRLGAMEALLPPLARDATEPLPERVAARGAARGRAGLLLGCVQRFFFRQVNADTARLLSAAGWEVIVPAGQGCCGALHLHAGRLDEFRGMARDLMAAFGADVDVVVANAAGCGSALKEYGHWLGDREGREFSARARDVSEILADVDLPLRRLPVTVAYHDACHLAHGQRIREEPRRLLARIPGVRLVELEESDLCCGSAGVYNLVEPEVAAALGRRKAERVKASGARIVAAANPGCIMQIARHCRELGAPVEVAHPVSLLARALGAP
jgi:glycolate oxidase iron-sulfur subunit